MDCTCTIDIDDQSGGWDVYSSTTIKARKKHKCTECHRVIEPGETYERVKGLFDGCWWEHKTCVDCLSIRNEFFCSWTFESVVEHLNEYINDADGEIPEDCIANLTLPARERVCEVIEEHWEWKEY
ncbi:hypothetical protein DRO91_06085 [Candidatus Heimdallarchaeota archaeon]|nr:MAG: hypothetical protein DRO91_06085 [Candidatus Heimdallarchaeota archaeon]